jgi:hypothetical protein
MRLAAQPRSTWRSPAWSSRSFSPGLQEDLDTHIAWVDFTVHKLMPVVLVVDWLLEPARDRLPLWTAAGWLAYPLAWFTYTLVRGASEHWYPYAFVDVASHGYGRVLVNAAVLVVCFAGGALVFLLIGNWRTRTVVARAGSRSASASA